MSVFRTDLPRDIPRHSMPISLELPPDFYGTIHLLVYLPDSRCLPAQLLITDGSLEAATLYYAAELYTVE